MKTEPFFQKRIDEISRLPEAFQNEEIEDIFMLLSAQRPGGQHHFHAYKPQTMALEDFRQPAIEYLGINPAAKGKPDFKAVHFQSRLALGDAMMMTAGIRDFHAAYPEIKIKVTSTAPRVWDNNPYIDQDITPDKTFNVGTGWLTNASNRLNLHMANAYRISIQNETGLHFEQGPIKPDIWLSEEEYNADPIIQGPYWVIVKGGEIGWPLKMYPVEKWQEVVDMLTDIKFVELGTSEHVRAHGKLQNNKGNVIDFVGKTQDSKTGIRDLYKIFLHAQGSIGLVSMHMHLSAAFGNPCVVVAGAREPSWFTQYYGHQYLHTNGCLPCAERKACWHCDTPACKNLIDGKIPKCVDIIKPQDIARAIMKYYDGGRLILGQKIKNTAFQNINRGAKGKNNGPVKSSISKPFTKVTISKEGWEALEKYCKKVNPRRILEYGPGLSTELFQQYAKVDSIESEPHKFNMACKTLVSEPTGRYDFAFIDGPKGAYKDKAKKIESYSRYSSVQRAREHTDIIIMHNVNRPAERAVCDILLNGWDRNDLYVDRGMAIYFRPSATGGEDRGVQGSGIEPGGGNRKESPVLNPKKGLVKLLTSCRGYGGSEKSTLMLMRMFLEKGYSVDLVPWGGEAKICNPYRAAIPEGVNISKNLDPCDIFLYYATDTVYFPEIRQDVFTDKLGSLKVGKKILIANYRLGPIGKDRWTTNWDLYMFLCTQKEQELKKRLPDIHTAVLAPPTDLTSFLGVERSYKSLRLRNRHLKLIRHNAQGDSKWRPDINDFITRLWGVNKNIDWYCMPAATYMVNDGRIHKFGVNQEPIPDFLAKGDLFIYNLPDRYQDQGPRVIMEAMATGLPVIADNRWGAKDRVSDETGWLCDSTDDYVKHIQAIVSDMNVLKNKGRAAREYAEKVFDPYRWVEEILK
jgi:ADP-heptose:LPS heptosyltransferase